MSRHFIIIGNGAAGFRAAKVNLCRMSGFVETGGKVEGFFQRSLAGPRLYQDSRRARGSTPSASPATGSN